MGDNTLRGREHGYVSRREDKMTKKPACFGDDTQYSETSRICSQCPFRYDCKREVDAGARAPAWGARPAASATNAATPAARGTNGYIAPVTAARAAQAVGASPYNFNNALAPQFMHYLGYSVVEVTLQEGLSLVQQARANYAHNNVQEISAVVQTAANAAIPPATPGVKK